MYICICHGITDHQIRDCVKDGARTMCDLRGQLGVATQCGSCECSAMQILDETLGCSSDCSVPSSRPSIPSQPASLATAA